MNTNQIQHAYTLTAEEYADKFFHEFDHKPFDWMVLKRFAEGTNGAFLRLCGTLRLDN